MFEVLGVYGGGDAGGADVAAGVFAVTGGGACGAAEGGVAAGALPALGELVGFVALGALFGVAAVALSAFAAAAAAVADFAVGGVAVAVALAVAVAVAGAAALAADVAAYALEGITNAKLPAQPSAHTAPSAARLALNPNDGARLMPRRCARVESCAFTTALSTARYASEAACRATQARYTR
ncbi:hypothetical protein FVF58_04585 [Paraburkholderia panacisoli]|uniref:Uncharacterized protein n=1 Tax=Paraburkholderia panacisoli TaxID=2603818 RepID=A0A5B0HIV9_9BURK|nr:hypothetical protein FVF58_04585 [Paraburkholderia panacisoli]